MTPQLDISDSFEWVEDLPRPQWDVIEAWVESHVGDSQACEVWTDIARQWLHKLGEPLGPAYEVHESTHCLLLAPFDDDTPELLLRLLESSRHALLSILEGVAEFRTPGKQVAIVLGSGPEYYAYVSAFDAEGHHGGSIGSQIRQGYPHVVACGRVLFTLQSTLAHEMTHAALAHLTLPLWLEEGLTQMFEQDMVGRQELLLDGEIARRHKRYWAKHGLQGFWSGAGFSQPGKVQELCYQLSEILLRLLAAEHRPRWFGFDRGPQRRLQAFLREADASDCGQAAAVRHLYFDLAELAAKVLGPGDWSPEAEADESG
jgi:hypothetical protein